MAFDQAKTLMALRKAQKELSKEVVEVSAGDGAVKVQVTGELKIKKFTLDAEKIDIDDMPELERWLEAATRDALAKAQESAANKMKPLMGGLGNLGL